MHPACLEASLGRSLESLGLEAVDLLYIHNAAESQLRAVGRPAFMQVGCWRFFGACYVVPEPKAWLPDCRTWANRQAFMQVGFGRDAYERDALDSKHMPRLQCFEQPASPGAPGSSMPGVARFGLSAQMAHG